MKLLFLPFIPAIEGVVILVALVMSILFAKIWGKDKKLSICVLGPNESGKTLFFNALKGKYEVLKDRYIETSREDIKEFVLTLPNGKEIKFADTVDINGHTDWIRNNYENILEGKNRVFFFCDICKYLSKEDYERDVNARLHYIYEIMINKGILVDNFYIVLSHADECKDRNDSKKQFQKKIQGKSDYGIFSSRVKEIVNMTNSEEVKKLINKMFS